MFGYYRVIFEGGGIKYLQAPVGQSLNIMELEVSDHMCYILKSSVSNRMYIGYTVNFHRRIRQHNGEIVGGAKRTRKGRPWYPICFIKGFCEASMALRFEYRLQHSRIKRKNGEDAALFALRILNYIINNGDGSIAKGNKMPWIVLTIQWIAMDSRFNIPNSRVINQYLSG